MLDEENPRRGLTLTQADFWIRQGLFGPKAVLFINYWRQALVDPEKAMHNATYRPYVARALRDLLDLCIDDTMLNNRIRTILTKYKYRGDEDELPEDEDVNERARFARWKAGKVDESFSSHSTAELAHMMASEPDPGRKLRLAQELRRRTGNRVKHSQLRTGGR